MASTIAHLTPVEARRSFNQWIDTFLLARGPRKRDAALQVRQYLAEFPWLHDQIPYDVLGLVRICERY